MPNHSLPRSGALFVLLLVAALLVASPVFAKFITVDGNPADWATVPVVNPVISDPADAGSNNRDIRDVYVTNSSTTLYFRFDTTDPTDWGPNTVATFCLNTDNNPGTGGPCSTQGGTDYIVTFSRSNANPNDPTLSAQLQRCVSGNCSPASANGIQGAREPNGETSEFGIPVAMLQATSLNAVTPDTLPANCTSASPCPIQALLIFDVTNVGGVDDTVSFGFQIPVVPTPVTLTAFSATRGENGVDLAWATSSELNIQGFHILRSAGGREAATRITAELIPGEGSGVTGGTYRFTDTGAAVGSSYSYWLEVINSDGTPEEYGPARYNPATAAPTLVYLPLVRQ